MLYAAYGSDMNMRQMDERCPHAMAIGKGRIKGWRFCFNSTDAIYEAGNEEDFVPVVIWDVPKEGGNWQRLDGCHSDYESKTIDVELDNGASEVATVYIKNADGIHPPERHYFNSVVRGAAENYIDIEYLYEALEYACANELK